MNNFLSLNSLLIQPIFDDPRGKSQVHRYFIVLPLLHYQCFFCSLFSNSPHIFLTSLCSQSQTPRDTKSQKLNIFIYMVIYDSDFDKQAEEEGEGEGEGEEI